MNKLKIMHDAYQYANEKMSHNELFYHTIFHVDKMIKDLDEFCKTTELTDDEYFKLYVAICFHDIVYEPGSYDNEKRSAEEFENRHYDLDKKTLEKIKNLILSTQVVFFMDKNIKTDDTLEKIMHTLDWNGFVDYKTMTKNREKIFFEACAKNFEPITILETQINFYYSIMRAMNKGYKIDYFNEENNKKAYENLNTIVNVRTF